MGLLVLPPSARNVGGMIHHGLIYIFSFFSFFFLLHLSYSFFPFYLTNIEKLTFGLSEIRKSKGIFTFGSETSQKYELYMKDLQMEKTKMLYDSCWHPELTYGCSKLRAHPECTI